MRNLKTDCNTSLALSFLNVEEGISEDDARGLEELADEVSEVLSRSFQYMAGFEESSVWTPPECSAFIAEARNVLQRDG